MAQPFDSSISEAEAGRFLWVQGQPGLHREFQDSQGYMEKSWKNKVKRLKIGLKPASDFLELV